MKPASDGPSPGSARHGIYLIDIDTGAVRYLNPPGDLSPIPIKGALDAPPVKRREGMTFVRGKVSGR